MLSPKIVTKITAFWILGYCSMYYSGPFIAGTLTDYLSFSGTVVSNFDSSIVSNSWVVPLFKFKINTTFPIESLEIIAAWIQTNRPVKSVALPF